MNRFGILFLTAVVNVFVTGGADGQQVFEQKIRPLLQRYCWSCHNEQNAEAKYRIDDINGNIEKGGDTVRWEKALEMISLGDMPPADADRQPTKAERQLLKSWIGSELKKIGRGKLDEELKHPRHANRIDHDELFSGSHQGPAYSPSRIWRISPPAYAALISFDGSDATLDVLSGHGFKDYASLIADEAAVNVLLRSADLVASTMVGDKTAVRRGSIHREWPSRIEKRALRQLVTFVEQANPREEHFAEAVTAGFRAIYGRNPSEEQRSKYLKLVRETTEAVNARVGAKTMLKAMMMSSEFIYRMELGMGRKLSDGRRMLSPMELAYAISFAITDSVPDEQMFQAIKDGRLETKEDVEREVRRLLAIQEDPRHRIYYRNGKYSFNWFDFPQQKPRLLRFFREFFGYERAEEVFKDETRRHEHFPKNLIRDADQLVLYAIEKDKQVLEFLLTTDRYFVSYFGSPESYHEHLAKVLAEDGKNNRWLIEQQKNGVKFPPFKFHHHIGTYGLSFGKWNYVPEQPFKQPVPRAGILTHPAWLIAHSGNFDNDIVRRGKWIREHLLADVVPELPIGVDAQLSTDPTKTLREKFDMKVRKGECWRCHKKMNPLGNAFEMYDDFGHYRTRHHFDHKGNLVGSPRELYQMQKKASHKHNAGKPEFLTTTKPVDTTGMLDGSGDQQLDGQVKNAVDLMHRLARSTRVRQSFVRHCFRYWMGRNETLNDSPTLIAVDKAYVDSNGSFTELLVSLLTSDSFLYRK